MIVVVVGVVVGLVLVVASVARARRRRRDFLAGAAWEPGMPSRLRDPETGEFL